MHLLPIVALGTLMLPLAAQANDPNSYAQPDQVQVTHLDLDLKIDFAQRQLDGQATLKLDWKNAQAQSLVLDTRDLKIAKVEALGANGKATALTYALAPRDQELGSKLTIAAPQRPSTVRIRYRTSPEASGLQWMTPAQTAGQAAALHVLAIRIDPRAQLGAAAGLAGGALHLHRARQRAEGAARGDERRSTMPRIRWTATSVSRCSSRSRRTCWRSRSATSRRGRPARAAPCTPSRRSSTQAAQEFADTEKMIAATEKLYGPYRWGRYDILVLPPSFPFGGMENPSMTFATPTVIVGDKSLVSLVAHELAHSWSGNLVTNAAWKRHLAQRGLHHLRREPHRRGRVRQGAGRRGMHPLRPTSCAANSPRRRTPDQRWCRISTAATPTMR